jgi:hypothetical protein
MTHKAFTYFRSCVFTMVYKSNPLQKEIIYSFHWNHLMGYDPKKNVCKKGHW